MLTFSSGKLSCLILACSSLFLTGSILPPHAWGCEGSRIICPLKGGCPTPTEGGKFQRDRVNPVTGQRRNHNGVDYRASRGTEIRAAAGGVIEKSYVSSSYGETIIVRHNDGSATLYAHLEKRLHDTGVDVIANEKIGTVDSTGISSGDHLHFEYVPSGDIIGSKARVDPDECVDSPSPRVLSGEINFTGTVFNSKCEKNVPVRGRIDLKVFIDGDVKFSGDVVRFFGPLCFSHRDQFNLADKFTRKGVESVYEYRKRDDPHDDYDLIVEFFLDDRANVTFVNRHHFEPTGGPSNIGTLRGSGEVALETSNE